MNSNRITSNIVFIKGMLMIVIGIIHTIFIYFEFQEALKNMSEYWAMSHALWFAATGLFFIYTGIIDLLSYKGLKRGSRHEWVIALISAFFPLICGAIGTYVFRNDEMIPVFPMLICFLGIISFVTLIINKWKFKNI
ncbi:MAG: hypothetical protein JW864_06525 [Spirochaetes bacterium]|nr:hypothetical protein [Spirochaetota bacterium]